jgi:lipopolysaccharide/colanic/teichoic acid biosynthesis glycosyltransferase
MITVHSHGSQRAVKRSLDLIGAVIALVLLLPLLVAIAVAVKASSQGPILVRVRRYGKDSKVLRVYEFRTKVWRNSRPGSGADVTAVGQFLRTYNFQRLPWLIHVLAGEMSLIDAQSSCRRAGARLNR